MDHFSNVPNFNDPNNQAGSTPPEPPLNGSEFASPDPITAANQPARPNVPSWFVPPEPVQPAAQVFQPQPSQEPPQPSFIPPEPPAPANPWAAAAPPSFQAPIPPQAPEQPPQRSSDVGSDDVTPKPVLQVFSTRGVEYAMLTLCLWLGAIGVLWILLALFNGRAHFSILGFPVALLLVTLPVFYWFFMRLKAAELANPALKLDPSKRRLTQITQLFTFGVSIFNIVIFIYLVLLKIAGQGGPSVFKDILNLLAVGAVAGGVLAYYWNDEHRGR